MTISEKLSGGSSMRVSAETRGVLRVAQQLLDRRPEGRQVVRVSDQEHVLAVL